jgi:hypothetical protein
MSLYLFGMTWKENATKDELAALAKHGKRKMHYKRLAALEQAEIMRIYERVKKRRQRLGSGDISNNHAIPSIERGAERTAEMREGVAGFAAPLAGVKL